MAFYYGQQIGAYYNPYGNVYVTPQVHVIPNPVVSPIYYGAYGQTLVNPFGGQSQNQAPLPRDNSTTMFRRDAYGNVWYQDR